MSEPYRANLARVDADSEALAARTKSLAAFRSRFGRRLSPAVRDGLRETAERLERTAAGLRDLATTGSDDEVARVIERARQLGVPL